MRSETRRPESVRRWLEATHVELRPILPPGTLTTPSLVESAGQPADVVGRLRAGGAAPLQKMSGLITSALAAGVNWGDNPRAAWAGFQDVWIPINSQLQLSGRLGLAEGGAAADCLIFVPGLFGDNTSPQTRAVCMALRERGFHVLALEERGAGLTEERYPSVPYAFGVLEAGDLLAVDEWLTERSDVRRTGIIGFCWGANTALLAAWEDGRRDDDPDVAPQISRQLRPRSGRGHFEAGVLACSPPLRFQAVVEKLEQPVNALTDPAYGYLSQVIETRMRLKGDAPAHSILQLRAAELARGGIFNTSDAAAIERYVELMPERGGAGKLDRLRVPALIVYGADDPVAPAQPVADLMARTRNQNVAAVILPGGGHCGFAAYAPQYFYQLVTRFFDAGRNGPAYAAEAEFRQ